MKTVRFLNTITVSILMCVGLSACGSSNDDNFIEQNENNMYNQYLGTQYKEMTNLSLSDVTVLDNSGLNAICIMGLKQGNLYIGIFEKNEPYTALLEWTDPNPLNKHLNVNMGYVNDIDFNTLELSQIVKYEKTYFIISATDIKTSYNSIVDKVLIFNNGKKTYEGAFIAGQFREWYDGYVCLSAGNETIVNPSFDSKSVDSMIFSPQGELVSEMTSKIISNLSYDYCKRISYCEGICATSNSFESYHEHNGCRFYRQRFDEIVWNTYYDISFDSNVKDELTLLDSSTNIWKYQLKLTYTNGDIKTTTIYVNIDNGKILTTYDIT